MIKVTLYNTSIDKIYKSGQCFGISQNPYNLKEYWCVSGDKFCRVVSIDALVCELTCPVEDKEYWLHYFSMDVDYKQIGLFYIDEDNTELSEDIIEKTKGLRMLRQEFPDCLVSFIMSQRRSVPSIRTSIGRFTEKYGKCYNLSEYYGKEYSGFSIYTFPQKDRYFSIFSDIDGLKEIGLGYRAPYVSEAFRWLLSSGLERNNLSRMGYEEAKIKLKGILGVGEKVANCVLLYSLGYIGAYPRDIWIQRFENAYYQGHFYDNHYPYTAGIIQLWQYYYIMNT